jgi:DtxR family Mn-dependent transcriptional regulator
MHSAVVEDYVKTIYKLQTQTEAVSTSALAERTGTTAAAVTKMLKHLAQLHLVSYTPYHGVRLTPMGEKIALEVIRHHRLLELYLAQAMGYSWDQVDAEAEKLEHVISEEFEARIDTLLGHPQTCPHGDPIPSPDGTLVEERLRTLSECRSGEVVFIARVKDRDAAVLRSLSARAMTLEAAVTVLDRDDVDHLLTIQVSDRQHVIGQALATSVFVSPRFTESIGKEENLC